MPFMHIYKLPDDKWHMREHAKSLYTKCGQVVNRAVEERKIGGSENAPDPPRSAVCERCFNFLPPEPKQQNNEHNMTSRIKSKLLLTVLLTVATAAFAATPPMPPMPPGMSVPGDSLSRNSGFNTMASELPVPPEGDLLPTNGPAAPPTPTLEMALDCHDITVLGTGSGLGGVNSNGWYIEYDRNLYGGYYLHSGPVGEEDASLIELYLPMLVNGVRTHHDLYFEWTSDCTLDLDYLSMLIKRHPWEDYTYMPPSLTGDNVWYDDQGRTRWAGGTAHWEAPMDSDQFYVMFEYYKGYGYIQFPNYGGLNHIQWIRQETNAMTLKIEPTGELYDTSNKYMTLSPEGEYANGWKVSWPFNAGTLQETTTCGSNWVNSTWTLHADMQGSYRQWVYVPNNTNRFFRLIHQ